MKIKKVETVAQEKNRVEVIINRKPYTIIAEEKQEYLLSLAEYVNEHMQEITKANPYLSQERAAVLTALNLCDTYFKLQKSSEELEKQVVSYSKELGRSEAKMKKLQDEMNMLKEQTEKKEQEMLDMIDRM